ncbi:MAG: HmuY family protein [Gemmatimonadaceae bacterium]|nr:HmuY family protein [Gemmatimonadaceae bacterium]
MKTLLNYRVSRSTFAASVAILGLAGLTACESESAPTGPEGPSGELAINEVRTLSPINATSNDTLVHVNLATGAVVPASGTWDIALRRFEVRLNSPAVAGTASRNVTGYAVAENRNATNEQVMAFTPAATLSVFDQFRAAQIPADTAFKSDVLSSSSTSYLTFGAVPAANAARYWKVRAANGAFALFRVSALTFTPAVQVASITFEVRQQTGTTLGAAQSFTINAPTAPVAISLTSAQSVTPNGCNWDFTFDPSTTSLALTSNTACNVATSPGPTSPAFAAATSASDAAQYVPYLSVLSGPIPNSSSDKIGPFLYNLAGTNRLHPTFNTYLVRSGALVYKVQFINYYGETGTSGYVTLRYARIR